MITGKTLFMYACPETMIAHKWAVGNGQLDEHRVRNRWKKTLK
jgi:hypothetical protein